MPAGHGKLPPRPQWWPMLLKPSPGQRQQPAPCHSAPSWRRQNAATQQHRSLAAGPPQSAAPAVAPNAASVPTDLLGARGVRIQVRRLCESKICTDHAHVPRDGRCTGRAQQARLPAAPAKHPPRGRMICRSAHGARRKVSTGLAISAVQSSVRKLG